MYAVHSNDPHNFDSLEKQPSPTAHGLNASQVVADIFTLPSSSLPSSRIKYSK